MRNNNDTIILGDAIEYVNKSILNKGNPLALRLPKLPAGYTYNEFVISGTSLYASWEETSFFKTGRSGFIQINLDSLLY